MARRRTRIAWLGACAIAVMGSRADAEPSRLRPELGAFAGGSYPFYGILGNGFQGNLYPAFAFAVEAGVLRVGSGPWEIAWGARFGYEYHGVTDQVGQTFQPHGPGPDPFAAGYDFTLTTEVFTLSLPVRVSVGTRGVRIFAGAGPLIALDRRSLEWLTTRAGTAPPGAIAPSTSFVEAKGHAGGYAFGGVEVRGGGHSFFIELGVRGASHDRFLTGEAEIDAFMPSGGYRYAFR